MCLSELRIDDKCSSSLELVHEAIAHENNENNNTQYIPRVDAYDIMVRAFV